MLKTKTVRIDDRTFTIKELPVRQVWGLLNNDGEASMLERCQGLLQLGCPELDKNALLDLYPSEIEELWQAFEEVNAAFLGVVRLVGMDQALIDAVKTAVSSSIGQFAASLPAATAQECGSMAMASS